MQDLIDKASVALLAHHPFFGAHLCEMQVRLVPEAPFPAATDGHKTIIVADKQFREMLNQDYDSMAAKARIYAMTTVLAHEISHRVYMHTTAVQSLNPDVWNIAADARINRDLHAEGLDISKFCDIATIDQWVDVLNGDAQKAGPVLDLKFKKSWATMDIYMYIWSRLKEDKKKQMSKKNGQGYPSLPPQGQSQGQSQPQPQQGQGQSPGDLFKPDAAPIDVSKDVAQANSTAAKMAKLQGKLPKAHESLINPGNDVSIRWERELAKFIRASMAREDYSYRRLSRRPALQPELLNPGLLSETVGPIVAYVDTSGSMSSKELDVIAGHLTHIIRRVKPSELIILYGDTKVQHVDKFKPGDKVSFTRYGMGGTDFRPMLAWVHKNRMKPECFIMFSDGYGSFPPSPPKFPVLFGYTDPNCNWWPGWGKKLHVRIK